MQKIKVLSTMPPSTPMNVDTQALEFCNLDYMCIREPGGDVLIPDNYGCVFNLNNMLVTATEQLIGDLELSELDIDKDCYWYLSLKKGFINPGHYQTKNEWHIDGFLRDDYNFIWSDALPTVIAPGEFELTPNRYTSLNEYDEQVTNTQPSMVQQLYYLDRGCVHKPEINQTQEPIVRTFLKLTITKRLFNSMGNAWNYKIPNVKPTGIRTNFV